ncbi:MAG: hypothetical protein BJ554DRAFT_708, partial [Olpidium bornovanus]
LFFFFLCGIFRFSCRICRNSAASINKKRKKSTPAAVIKFPIASAMPGVYPPVQFPYSMNGIPQVHKRKNTVIKQGSGCLPGPNKCV